MNEWQDFPTNTPPEGVPLWLTVKYCDGVDCVGAKFNGLDFYDEENNCWNAREVVAFIVLPGPKA